MTNPVQAGRLSAARDELIALGLPITVRSLIAHAHVSSTTAAAWLRDQPAIVPTAKLDRCAHPDPSKPRRRCTLRPSHAGSHRSASHTWNDDELTLACDLSSLTPSLTSPAISQARRMNELIREHLAAVFECAGLSFDALPAHSQERAVASFRANPHRLPVRLLDDLDALKEMKRS